MSVTLCEAELLPALNTLSWEEGGKEMTGRQRKVHKANRETVYERENRETDRWTLESQCERARVTERIKKPAQ